MHDGTQLLYLTGDHLSSSSLVLDAAGAVLSEQRYKPFGQVRGDTGSITQTDFGYTGQRNYASFGLMDYNARFYDPTTFRFTQPDTIIPDPGNSQALNRYAYAVNNPIRYSDPSGHCADGLTTVICLAVGGALFGAGASYVSRVAGNIKNKGGVLPPYRLTAIKLLQAL